MENKMSKWKCFTIRKYDINIEDPFKTKYGFYFRFTEKAKISLNSECLLEDDDGYRHTTHVNGGEMVVLFRLISIMKFSFIPKNVKDEINTIIKESTDEISKKHKKISELLNKFINDRLSLDFTFKEKTKGVTFSIQYKIRLYDPFKVKNSSDYFQGINLYPVDFKNNNFVLSICGPVPEYKYLSKDFPDKLSQDMSKIVYLNFYFDELGDNK